MIITDIRIHLHANTLELRFDDGKTFVLPTLYLRQCSPSAEMRGHGGQPPKPTVIDPAVSIRSIEPVGNYAIKIFFSDGHSSGLYSWEYLYELGLKHISTL